MNRYLKIFFDLGKFSMMGAMEYRANVLFTGSFKLIESIASFVIIFLLVSLTSGIAEWSKSEVLLISLTFTLTTALTAFFVLLGMKQFAKELNIGNIDRYLLKPINTQFYASLSQWDWSQVFRIIGSIFGICLVIRGLNYSLPLINIAAYIILVFTSVLTVYGFAFIIISLVLFSGRIRNIDYLAMILWEPGKWPTSVFSGFWRIFFSVVIPVWFAATVPVGILTGKYSFSVLVGAMFFTLLTILLSNFFLNFGIKKYSSAGG
mgnify:CR=1 FL=1